MSDRPRIHSGGYAKLNPRRIAVHCDDSLRRPWLVYRGYRELSTHATHAEAITAAQQYARKETP